MSIRPNSGRKRTRTDPALVASELRVVLARLTRRLRAEHYFPLSQASVLAHLDREGVMSVSDLAVVERVKPQSMAQTVSELEEDGHVFRRPDPGDRRRALVELTDLGRAMLLAERTQREGWLAQAIAATLSREETALLGDALELLRRLTTS